MSDTTDATAPSVEQEVWRDIPSLNCLYQASSHGRIRSLPRATTRGGVMSQQLNRAGYFYFTPSVDGVVLTRAVAPLVCEAFHGPKPKDKDLAAHGDGFPENNRPENLRWATYRENEDDKRKHGRHGAGPNNPSAKLSLEQVGQIRQHTGSNKSVAKEFGVSKSLVFMIRSGEVWSDTANASRRTRRAAPFSIKRRSPPRRADKNGNSRLKWSDAREIRSLYASGSSQTEIAKRFGVTQGCVWTIVRNKAWIEKPTPVFDPALCCCM